VCLRKGGKKIKGRASILRSTLEVFILCYLQREEGKLGGIDDGHMSRAKGIRRSRQVRGRCGKGV